MKLQNQFWVYIGFKGMFYDVGDDIDDVDVRYLGYFVLWGENRVG